MPQTQTANFGLLDYSEEAVVEFPAGLPAFEDQRRFVVIERPDLVPLVFLQSLDRPELALPALPVSAVVPGYRLDIPEEDRTLLGLAGDVGTGLADLVCLGVVSIPRSGPATVNLMAPVVVNPARRRAVQVIQTNAPYSYEHPLFRAEEDESRCS